MAELRLNPDDIGHYCDFITAVVQKQKKNEDKGNWAEAFFLTGLVLGQRQPELIQEATNYIKYTRRMTLDEIVDGALKTLLDLVERYKKKSSDS